MLRSIFYLLLFVVLFSSCKTKSKVVTANRIEENASELKFKLVANIVTSATNNMGVKYRVGGTTKSGYDCSGLVYTAFAENGIPVLRTALQQSRTGMNLGKNTNKAQKGDLIFFRTNHSSQINHVGIITEVIDDEVKFVHASTTRGVIISSTKDPYYQKAFAQINRILE